MFIFICGFSLKLICAFLALEKLTEINTFRVRTTVSEIAVFSWRVTSDKKKDAEQREKLPELSCPILKEKNYQNYRVLSSKRKIT